MIKLIVDDREKQIIPHFKNVDKKYKENVKIEIKRI